MSTRLSLLAAFAALALTLAACGGDDEVTADAAPTFDASDTPTIDATPPDPTLADLCDETDGLYVDFFSKAFDCQRGLFELFTGGDLLTRAELAELCAGALGPYLTDGTVEFADRATFDACAAFVADLTCEDFSFDSPTPCDGVLVGTIPNGDDCDSSDQCPEASFCDKSGAGTCGVCTAKFANDAVCVEGSQCQSGYCQEVDGGDDVCAPLGVNGDDCVSSQDCLGSRVCDPSTDKCASAPATWSAGDPCSTFIFDCGGPGSDLYCHPGTQTCKAWLALSDPCPTSPPQADFCNLFEYETCQGGGPTGACTAPTIVTTPGGGCGFFTGNKCDTGMLCDQDDGTCKTIVPVGGNCSGANSTCEFFVNCVDGTCQYGEHSGMCPAP